MPVPVQFAVPDRQRRCGTCQPDDHRDQRTIHVFLVMLLRSCVHVTNASFTREYRQA
jgi:hypothetical protein